MFSDGDDLGVLSNEATTENVNAAHAYGTGLKNEVGEYNCFLNVIIQVGCRECSVVVFKIQCPLYDLIFLLFLLVIIPVLMALETLSR